MKMSKKNKALMKEMRNVCINYLQTHGVYDCVDHNYPAVCKSVENKLGEKKRFPENISRRLGHLYKTITGNDPLVEYEPPARRKKKEPKKRPDFSEAMNNKVDEFYESYAWRKLRYQIILKHLGRCQACGKSKDSGVVLHVDHIKPLRKNWGLRLDPGNLQVLCDQCNHGKGNWDETDWTLVKGEIYSNFEHRSDIRIDLEEFFNEWSFWSDLGQTLQNELVGDLIKLLKVRANEAKQ